MGMDITSLRFKEEKYYQIDRQFLTDGLRLVLLLPIFSLLFFFCAWAYNGTSPDWWLNNIEPSVGFDFSTCMTILSTTILLGFCSGLFIHRHRVKLTRLVFRHEVKSASESHRPVTSMHGYSSVAGLISQTMSSHNTSIWLAIIATVVSGSVAYLDSGSELGHRGILASSSLVMVSIAQHLSMRNKKFNMVTDDGLLSAYNPPVHPSTLNRAFNDMLHTQMDPLLRSKFEDFLTDLEKNMIKGLEFEFAKEKFLMIMHRKYKGSIDRNTTTIELGEILTQEGLKIITKHEIFNESLWDSLFSISIKDNPAFYRLIERMEQDLSIGRKIDTDGLLFDVDLENVVTDKANLFCYFHNITDKTKNVVLRVNSPDFRPHEISMRYELKPGEKNLWSMKEVPVSAQGDDDLIGKMSGLLRDGTISWQTILPEKRGEATVSVRLENTSGDLLVGRQINVMIRPDFSNWFTRTTSLTSYFIGGVGLVTSIFLQVMTVLSNA